MTSESEDCMGYDIAFFQRWRNGEHGGIKWIPGLVKSDSYKLNHIKKLECFLSKKNILLECFNLGSTEPLGELVSYNWRDVPNWNIRRLNSLNDSRPPQLSKIEAVDKMYSIRAGLVYKYTWNYMCLCVDKTYIIVRLQSAIRLRILQRKYSAHIIQKYWNRYSWDPNLPFGYNLVVRRAKLH
jgi:hypothetical protein